MTEVPLMLLKYDYTVILHQISRNQRQRISFPIFISTSLTYHHLNHRRFSLIPAVITNSPARFSCWTSRSNDNVYTRQKLHQLFHLQFQFHFQLRFQYSLNTSLPARSSRILEDYYFFLVGATAPVPPVNILCQPASSSSPRRLRGF